MANTTVNIDIEVQSKTLGQLEQELADINEELREVKVGSDAFKSLTKEAQKVSGQLEKVNKEIEGFTLEDSIQQADGAIKLLGGSLATVVGTLGVFGVESEAFGEFEEKAASAIAVTIGLKDATEGFGKIFPKTMAKAVTSVKTFGKGANKALLATGIGAFVVALGAIVANWDAIVGGIKKVVASSAGLTKFFNGVKAGFSAVFESIRPVLEFFGLYPTLEEEAAEAVRKSNEEQIPALEQRVKLMRAQKKSADELFEAEKKLLETRIASAKDEEERLKAQNELAILVASNDTRLAEEKEAKRKEQAEKNKAALEERKANEQEAFDFLASLQQEELDLLAKTDEEKLKLDYDRTLAEIDALKVSEEEKNKIKLQAEENYNLQLKDLKAQQEEENKKQLEENQAEINSILEQIGLERIGDVFERAKAELKIEEEKEIARLTAIGATEEQIAQVKAYYAAENAKIVSDQRRWEEMEADAKKEFILNTAAETFANLSTILGEESKAGKAAAIGEAIIKTYQAANAAYASLAGIPIVGPALGAVAAAAAVASGIANVKKIKATKTPGGDSGPAVPSPSVPVGPRRAEAPNNIQPQAPQFATVQPAVKAYVLSGDVTSSQEADAKLNRKRTIAG